jgi:charged multivesicular body protein 2A
MGYFCLDVIMMHVPWTDNRINEIKKLAKDNQMGAVNIMARDLVQNKRFCTKMLTMKSHLQGINMRMLTMKSTHEMTAAMRGVTVAMGRMNKTMNMPQMAKIMRDFERQSEITDMTQEMMGEGIDDMMADDEDEEESEMVVSQVLAEIGLTMSGELAAAPTAAPAGKEAEASGKEAVADQAVSDLEARLDNLKR